MNFQNGDIYLFQFIYPIKKNSMIDRWIDGVYSQFLLSWGIIGKMEKKKNVQLGEMDVLSFAAFFDQSLRAILSPGDHFNLIWC